MTREQYENHDCKLSPDDGCDTCDKWQEWQEKVEEAMKKITTRDFHHPDTFSPSMWANPNDTFFRD